MELASYMTGFVDGEGCFSISFNFRKRLRTNIEVRPSFSVSQHRRNLGVIKFLYKYFQCGGIRFSRRDSNYKYEVRNISDLVEIIIPHFEKYPLRTSKTEDFAKFAKICRMMKRNLHLNIKKLGEIIELAYQMNSSGKRRYKKEELLRVLDKMKI